MNRLILILPLVGFLALSGLLYSGIGKDPSVLPSALIDRPAPDFAVPELLEPTRTVGKADWLGKPYLLNVWASWCGACQIEHQVITDIAQSGVVPVYGLNWKDERSEALRWLDHFGNPYAAIAHDPENEVGIDFGVYGAPETFLIDAQGHVRFKHVGPLTEKILNEQIIPILNEVGGG
ncbi:MAG: DsbE family thiol:disulfide interchange protein [Xanthomonadales bacterium]|nr:DsbE family thiol:disulfide interchange protein [Xanthomonadales bacterium]